VIAAALALTGCSTPTSNLGSVATASVQANPGTVSSWPTLGNDASNTATTTAATTLWDQQTGSTHHSIHALFAGDDPAGAEQDCTVVALTAPNPTGGLLIAWFMSAESAGTAAPTYLGQTTGRETTSTKASTPTVHALTSTRSPTAPSLSRPACRACQTTSSASSSQSPHPVTRSKAASAKTSHLDRQSHTARFWLTPNSSSTPPRSSH
jgi:hypothetical protein